MSGTVVIWLIVAVVLGIVEGLTVSLISIWMAIGAVVASVIAAFGGSVLAQILAFLIVSAILLVLTIPFSKRFRKNNVSSTNADRLLGAEGIVIVKIEPIENSGQIKVMGQVWSAASKDHSAIEIGEKVTVVSIEGVKAIVEKAE